MDIKQYKLSEPYDYQNDKEYSENEYFSFWDEVAKKYVKWDKIYDQVYSDNEWYKGGKLNACYNVLDIHALNDETKDKIALIYECPVKQISYKITYKELFEQVCKFSRLLKNLGVNKGDGVLIYMKSSFQAVISMLSCARIGAIHCVVYAEFSSSALAERIDHFKPKLIICADCGVKGYGFVDYLSIVEKALELSNHKVDNTIVYYRYDFIDKKENQSNVEPLLEYEKLDSCDTLLMCYSSGTSGPPKGFECFVGPHTVLVSYSFRSTFKLKQGNVFSTSCDIGWLVGQSYGVYACLQMGVVSILFEGDLIIPNANNIFKIVETHNVDLLFISPTEARIIRELDPKGDTISNLNLSSLKNMFMGGENADEFIIAYVVNITDAKVWDSYGQTEMGCPVLSQYSITQTYKKGTVGRPSPGINITIVSKDNKIVKPLEIGEIVVKLPLHPSAVTSIYKDQQNYNKIYLERNRGYYSTGDMGYFDEDGYYYILSRIDETIHINDQLIYCGQVEGILLKHSSILDCAILDIRDKTYGSRLVALVVPNSNYLSKFKNEQFLNQVHSELNLELKNQIDDYAKLLHLIPVSKIPRNRNGKKTRQLLSKIVNNEPFEIPITISNVADVKKLSIEIEQFKLNIPNQRLD